MESLTMNELLYQAWLYNVNIEDTVIGLRRSGYIVRKYFVVETWVRFDDQANKDL